MIQSANETISRVDRDFFGLISFAYAQSTPTCATISHTLSLGSRGAEVNQLQTVLGIPPSGYFSAITKQKLIVWQIIQDEAGCTL